MTSETYQELSFERKGQKRPSRPKLLKLTDVSMPNRNRKKTKFKIKERSQSNVREKLFDDPAYTDDVSHLAIPIRRNSGPDKVDTFPLMHKRKSSHKDSQHSKRNEPIIHRRDCSSSSDDSLHVESVKHKRGQSLERGSILDRSPKKREKRDRAAKQKRNLSLDNTLTNSFRRSLEKSSENSLKTASIERERSRQKSMPRQNVSEGWSSCLAATSDSSKATEADDSYSSRKEFTKMQIGKRFLKGEIGIKSFNYYLLKEGLKSSKKFVDKQRNSLTKSDSKKLHSKSEENIYEEIFFVDKNSDSEDPIKFPDCELCVQQCSRENCEYCLDNVEKRPQDYYSLGRSTRGSLIKRDNVDALGAEDMSARGAHILQYQSYNPNNPGVYKIETTPVAFTSDYNPIHQLHQAQHQQHQQHLQQQLEQQQQLHQQQQQQQQLAHQRRNSKNGNLILTGRINTKSSSSSDSLHHKYAKHRGSQDFYECPPQPQTYGTPPQPTYDQKIYKSDSRVSILSEYSIRSESSNRNFRCGEVSDSSLGDSMFSAYSNQRRYFGSSESCRFGFECRRCSLDGEKCSFSDTCRYECRNCDCSSSYFSSDFDELNNSRKSSTRLSSTSQKSYEYYNDTVDVKQNKYAQDFIKHVNDVKRSIYQAELQRTIAPTILNSYGTIPPPRQLEIKKSINSHSQQAIQPHHLAQQQQSRSSGGSPFKIAHKATSSLYAAPLLKDIRDNKNLATNPPANQTIDSKISKVGSGDAKGAKYAEAKYAKISTVAPTSLTQTQSQRMSVSEHSKHDKKDSLGRSQRKQTGAIPKSSSSSATSATTLPQTAKSLKNASSKDRLGQKILTTERSPYTSPRHTQRTTSKDSNRSTDKTSDPSVTIKETIAARGSTNGTMEPATTGGADASPESRKSSFEKVAENSPGPSTKEEIMCQDNHKSRKAYTDANNEYSVDDAASKDVTSESKQGKEQHSNGKKRSDKTKKIKEAVVDRKKESSSGTTDKKFLMTPPKAPEWSDFDDEDDDVFIDARSELLPEEKSISNRKRCLALPATPNTASTPTANSSFTATPDQKNAASDSGTGTGLIPPPPSIETSTATTPLHSPGAVAKGTSTEIPVTVVIPEGTVMDSKSTSLQVDAADGKCTESSAQKGKPAEVSGSKSKASRKATAKAQSKTILSSPSEKPQQIVDSVSQIPQSGGAQELDAVLEKFDTGESVAAVDATASSTSSSNVVTGETTAVGSSGEMKFASPTRAGGGGDLGATSMDEFSRETDVAGVTFNRDQKFQKQTTGVYSQDETTGIDTSEATSTDDSKLTRESTRSSNDLSTSGDKIDISDLPLPEIPPKKRRSRTDKSGSKRDRDRERIQNEPLVDNYAEPSKIRTSEDFLRAKYDSQKMHYHSLGHHGASNNTGGPLKPATYLFGENRITSNKKNNNNNSNNTDEIFLNKSGWVQVSSKRINDENSTNAYNRKTNMVRLDNQNGGHRNSIRVIQIDNNVRDKPIYAVPRVANSKIEDLISRNEARRTSSTPKTYLRPGYKIVDPQIASILNERPGFLPVKTFIDIDSAPPITPILSPPPAFQDSKGKYRNDNNINVQTSASSGSSKYDPKVPKGMVFSRSFEYDRKPADYAETFSKSFDCNLSDKRPVQRDRSPNFSTLTGCSPNYMTKKEATRSRDNSPKYHEVGPAYLAAAAAAANASEVPAYSNPKKLDKYGKSSLDRNNRSRRAQFSRVQPHAGFKSFDTTVNQRLNSCDSGARSDLSNDEIDDEDEEEKSSQFLSASYQPQGSFSRTQSNAAFLQKQRSLTPERYESNSYQNSLRKQRSLTPESRSLTPEERRKKGSQISLGPRPNSGSRASTLERKTKYEEKSLSASRSSSSSSYSGREHESVSSHRRSTVRTKTNEEHRIRRSRSLQLTERSPSRSAQPHKMIVCVGSMQQANPSPIYQQPVRNFPPVIRPNRIINDQSSSLVNNNRQSRNSDIDKSRSFDLDFGTFNNQSQSTRLDFDKSRSFDEDYREQSNKMRYMTDTGVIRDDHLTLKPNMQRNTTIPRQTSPQNYGTRLCDHELTYDMLRRTLDRSPIMDFSRDHEATTTSSSSVRSREKLTLGSGSELNFLNERIYDRPIKLCDQSPNDSTYSMDRLLARESITTPETEVKSIRDTFAGEDRLRSSNDRITDYLYRQQPQKGQLRSHQSLTGNSTPASCTASSCDFWPHCGWTSLKTNKKSSSVDHPNRCSNSAAIVSDPQLKIRAASDDDDFVDEKHKSTVSVNCDGTARSANRHYRKSSEVKRSNRKVKVSASGDRVVKAKPPSSASAIAQSKAIPSAVVFLGELEMPITRERDLQTSPIASGMKMSGGKSATRRITQPGQLEMQQSPTADAGHMISSSTKIKPPTAPLRNMLRRYHSQSLPNLFLQNKILSKNYAGDYDPFLSTLPNQMRAVSSPSLSENLLDPIKSKSPIELIDANEDVEDGGHHNHVGAIQKFKETFSQFKGTTSNRSNSQHHPQITTAGKVDIMTGNYVELESSKYRFGPLVWRSSKERRKTKHNRRDKCNSGDSGIQIELENDEQFGLETYENIENSPPLANVRVRRVNSAKATHSMTLGSTAKAKALRKLESYDNKITATPIPTRSLSQPSGLDRMARADVDGNDTDESASSHPDLHEANCPIFAEVLFPFTPGGPQELPLERGSLVQIIRKDTGPWWLGRIKPNDVLAKVKDEVHQQPFQGWFPKDFVRLITSNHRIDSESIILRRSIAQINGKTAIGSSRTGDILVLDQTNLDATNCDNRVNSISTTSTNSIILGSKATTTTAKSAVKTIISPSQKKPISQQQQQQKFQLQHHQNSEALRNSVIKELLETEINYVKLLSSLCFGYLKELQKRVDIFSTESLNLIFSNIESIFRFQKTFLDALRKGIESGKIAQVFIEYQSGFMVYSTYCNSYPRTLMELESYSSSKDVIRLFENCRIAENLPELPLSAHLLAPIQRICRYPLHLSELVKHTPPRKTHFGNVDKDEFTDVNDCKEIMEYALAAMKKVTEMVNEGKRHSENLTRFQASFENFQGPPIAFHSTRFFMQTDATRVSPNLWNNTYTLFLFDHQLIYCKKDLLKRNHFIYKGRIFLDTCRILNLPDGKLFGVSLKNALRMYCESRHKWFDFCFRSASRKLRFLSTLAAERQFCGTSLFVSELAGEDDEHLSDREYHSDYDMPTNIMERGAHVESLNSLNMNWKEYVYEAEKLTGAPSKQQKYSDTLPKKSRKETKDSYEFNTGSLGRRKIGSWFRKAKSTNTTPTQSPTHQSMMIFNSDSSSQSSPALGYKTTKSKIKDPTVSS